MAGPGQGRLECFLGAHLATAGGYPPALNAFQLSPEEPLAGQRLPRGEISQHAFGPGLISALPHLVKGPIRPDGKGKPLLMDIMQTGGGGRVC